MTVISTFGMGERNFDINNIDYGIRGIVIALREAGFKTITSCESGVGHAFKLPTVGVLLEHKKSYKLIDFLENLFILDFKLIKKISDNKGLADSKYTSGQFFYISGDGLLNIVPNCIRIGMTKKNVKYILGKPEQEGGISRKYKEPSVWKYGNLEFCFNVKPKIKPQPDAPLVCVFDNSIHKAIMQEESREDFGECMICKGTGFDRNNHSENKIKCKICDGEGKIYYFE